MPSAAIDAKTLLPLLSSDIAAVAESLRRSTVQVRGRGPGAGSGVIWRPDGLVITNAHVASGPDAVVELSDGRTFKALLVDRDPEQDLAALRVGENDLPAATIGDSDSLRSGELALAVGNPLELIGAVTVGIIHTVGPLPGLNRQTWVQADVRLAPGNSGGPLANAKGQVIGINSMIVQGLALAVPSNVVEQFLGGQPNRARSSSASIDTRW
jgi:serine protease Do